MYKYKNIIHSCTTHSTGAQIDQIGKLTALAVLAVLASFPVGALDDLGKLCNIKPY